MIKEGFPARGRSALRIVFPDGDGQKIQRQGKIRPAALYSALAATKRLPSGPYFTRPLASGRRI